MTTIVLGATGATGRLLVEQLLNKGHSVKAVVRSIERLPKALREHPNLTIIQASVLDLSDAELVELLQDCSAVASCLGHTLSLKGIYGQPRRLVTDTVRRVCTSLSAGKPDAPIKFVLMNTTGNKNRDLDEPTSLAQRCVISLIRFCIPPHVDNEAAADYLRTEHRQNQSNIEWVTVRPDGLINESEVSEYDLHVSPTRSAIFDAGQTSRINVAHFMAELITESQTWNTWKGQMPVIYNK